MPENAQTALTISPSTNIQLAGALGSMHEALLRAAADEVDAQVQGQGFTSLEVQAMKKIKALQLLNGFDLATILERGRLIHEIEQEGLVTLFPGDYHSLEEIAGDIGVSAAELSDTRALCDTIFPWIEGQTGQTVAYWWDRVGKSKFREMVPVLRALITGETATDRGSVAQSVSALLDAAQASATADGLGRLEDPVLRNRAAMNVLEFGSLPVREMRQQIRPVRTPNIPGIKYSNNSHIYVILAMDADQETMFSRLMGTHGDINPVSASDIRALASEINRLHLHQ